MSAKARASFHSFDSLDIRAGRIVTIDDAQTKKPTYRLTIDFGSELGTKVSCGAYRNYPKEALLGKIVICIVNFEPKKMGPETSEVLVLGIANERGETIYLTTEGPVPIGGSVF
jgi:tRNA-binding protein